MQVTITRTIQIPDDARSINELEGRIHSFGLSLMRELLSQSWQNIQSLQRSCEVCGSEKTARWGYRAYTVMTVFGGVKLRRSRVRCVECGKLSQPEDSGLKEVESSRASAGFAELACMTGASWPYKQAADILEKITGDSVSHECVRRLTNKCGQDALEAQDTEAEKELSEYLEPPSHRRGPEEVNVAVDGGWVRSRDNPKGMEGKVGVVYQGSEKVGEHRRVLRERRYVATFGSSDVAGRLIYAEARRAGVECASRKSVIGDGARWISSIADEHFPDALRILDLWHLKRRVYKTVYGCVPCEDAGEVSAMLMDTLVGGRADLALRQLDALSEKYPADRLGELATYIRNNAEWICDYDQLRLQGYPVGSGSVEKAVDIVINRRLKCRRAMRWRRNNADRVVALRTLMLNDDWDTLWTRNNEHS